MKESLEKSHAVTWKQTLENEQIEIKAAESDLQ